MASIDDLEALVASLRTAWNAGDRTSADNLVPQIDAKTDQVSTDMGAKGKQFERAQRVDLSLNFYIAGMEARTKTKAPSYDFDLELAHANTIRTTIPDTNGSQVASVKLPGQTYARILCIEYHTLDALAGPYPIVTLP